MDRGLAEVGARNGESPCMALTWQKGSPPLNLNRPRMISQKILPSNILPSFTPVGGALLVP